MKKHLKIASLLLALTVAGSFAGCSKDEGSEHAGKTENDAENADFSGNAEVSEDYFEWNDNVILSLTESGAKQESLVIPKRCEGFDGMILASKENNVKYVSFESDNDILLDGAFSDACALESIKLPAGITEISNTEFRNCEKLEEITIPAGVTEIGKYAFKDCTGLKKVVFEGKVTNIKPHAFNGCSSLSDVVFPETVSEIGEYAFFECTALKEVILPAGLTEIGAFAFAGTGLEKVIVPSAVTFTKYDTTSFAQADHDIEIFVTEGSWMDQNFESVFDGAFNKNYSK